MYVEDNNAMYVEGDNATTNDHCFDGIGHINKVDEKYIGYTSSMVICGDIFNSFKGNSYLKKYVVGLILEVKE